MKKILLSTSALVAAGFIAGGTAKADNQPISVTVGGYYNSAMAAIAQKDGVGEIAHNNKDVAFGEDIEINIGGSTTLDNGLTAGFAAHLEGTGAGGSGSPTLDERFVFFRGNFGQIRLGVTEDASQDVGSVFAPGAAGVLGVNSPFFRFSNIGNMINVKTYDDFIGDEDSLKLIYFSPSFNGFSFGLNYSPQVGTNGQGGGPTQYGGNVDHVNGNLEDSFAIGAAFDHDFGDIKLHVGGGWTTYHAQACGLANGCTTNPDSWRAGGTLTFGKVSIGGSYMQSDLGSNFFFTGISKGNNGSKLQRSDLDAGISYWEKMWGVGFQFGHAEQDNIDGVTDEKLDVFAINASYILGPGISVQAQVDYTELNNHAAGLNNDNRATTFMVGSGLSF